MIHRLDFHGRGLPVSGKNTRTIVIALVAILLSSTSETALASDPSFDLTRTRLAIPSLAEDVRTPVSPGTPSTQPPEPLCIPPAPHLVNGECEECLTYSIETVFEGYGLIDGRLDRNAESTPACLTSLLDRKTEKCRRFSAAGDFYRHFSSCMLTELAGYNVYTQWSTFWGNPENFVYGATPLGVYHKPFYFNVTASGRCVATDLPEGSICQSGTLHWYISPISLLLEADLSELHQNTKVVEFSLRPDGGKYSTWKASAKAPLLVFDPKHTGKITSPTQLFGNWTFGGKQTAAVVGGAVVDSGQGTLPMAWSNGFEALGTLDRDLDGVISGDELSVLGLWFDENQNARSEPGEVKLLAEVGITKLYYQDFEQDRQSNDLVALRGFERQVNGQVVEGVSVDWYGASADTELELVQKQATLDSFCALTRADTALEAPHAAVDEPVVQTGKSNGTNPFLGTWSWRSVKQSKPSKDSVSSGGVLVFAEGEQDKLIGLSLVEMALGEATAGTRAVLPVLLSAQFTKDIASGAPRPLLRFSHVGKDGSVIESTAALAADSITLEGSSVAYTGEGSKRRVKASYSWTAVRVSGGQL